MHSELQADFRNASNDYLDIIYSLVSFEVISIFLTSANTNGSDSLKHARSSPQMQPRPMEIVTTKGETFN